MRRSVHSKNHRLFERVCTMSSIIPAFSGSIERLRGLGLLFPIMDEPMKDYTGTVFSCGVGSGSRAAQQVDLIGVSLGNDTEQLPAPAIELVYLVAEYNASQLGYSRSILHDSFQAVFAPKVLERQMDIALMDPSDPETDFASAGSSRVTTLEGVFRNEHLKMYRKRMKELVADIRQFLNAEVHGKCLSFNLPYRYFVHTVCPDMALVELGHLKVVVERLSA